VRSPGFDLFARCTPLWTRWMAGGAQTRRPSRPSTTGMEPELIPASCSTLRRPRFSASPTRRTSAVALEGWAREKAPVEWWVVLNAEAIVETTSLPWTVAGLYQELTTKRHPRMDAG